MTRGFSPQDLQCPDPRGCPVAITRLAELAAQDDLPRALYPREDEWFRVYDARDGYGAPNPGFGDTRFAPFDALETGHRVPTMYLAESLEAALLETTLHDVLEQQPRLVAEEALLGKLHARVIPPLDLDLVDLRDDHLEELDLRRAHLASSSQEHYPCTQTIARAVHGSPSAPAGIVWHSRRAELSGGPLQEVAVVFADRVPTHRGAWTLSPRRYASGALLEGAGRLLLDELTGALDVLVVESGDL